MRIREFWCKDKWRLNGLKHENFHSSSYILLARMNIHAHRKKKKHISWSRSVSFYNITNTNTHNITWSVEGTRPKGNSEPILFSYYYLAYLTLCWALLHHTAHELLTVGPTEQTCISDSLVHDVSDSAHLLLHSMQTYKSPK